MVSIFCDKQLAYPFETEGEDNWMGRYFFTGGLMPAHDTVAAFSKRAAAAIPMGLVRQSLSKNGRSLAG